jgi:hypothetical protein
MQYAPCRLADDAGRGDRYVSTLRDPDLDEKRG